MADMAYIPAIIMGGHLYIRVEHARELARLGLLGDGETMVEFGHPPCEQRSAPHERPAERPPASPFPVSER